MPGEAETAIAVEQNASATSDRRNAENTIILNLEPSSSSEFSTPIPIG